MPVPFSRRGCGIGTKSYPAGEKPIPGVTTQLLLDAIRDVGDVDVQYAGSFDAMIDDVLGRLKPGDMVLTLGAGDIFKAGERLLERLEEGQ